MKLEHLGRDHLSVASSLLDMAMVLKQSDEGLAYAEEALAIYERNGRPQLLTIHGLAVLQLIHYVQGRNSESEMAAIEALNMAGDVATTNIPEVATILHVLAGTKKRQQKYDESEALARDAVTLHIKLHGGQHLQTAWAWEALGLTLSEQHKYAEAEHAYRNALMLFNRVPRGYAITKFRLPRRLAEVLRAQGDRAGAQMVWENYAVECRATVRRSPNGAKAHWRLGYALQQSGHFDEAVSAYEDAIRLAGDDAEVCKLIGWELLMPAPQKSPAERH